MLYRARFPCIPAGRGPMSSKKFLNSFHRSQTVMPRPPYSCHLGLSGFVHRCHIADHTKCVGDLSPRFRGLRSPTHLVWSAMWQRCTNPDNPKWQEYGGRGITVCERWKEFKNFLEDMGPRPAGMQGKRALYSIERMDNDGNYEPGNCKWATAKEQRANQRSFPSRPNRRAYSRSGQHIGSTG